MPSVCVFIRSDHLPDIAQALQSLNSPDIHLVMSGYGDATDLGEHYFKGGKWAGIFDYFSKHAEILERFDTFWFPDDDIGTTPENAARFLKIVAEHGLELAQPALTPDSYYADAITLENKRFMLRWTNFVELMLPLMSARLFARVLPLFQGRHTGQGLDFFWHQMTDNPARSTGIVDATPMSHLRPRRVHLKKNMQKLALDFQAEREQTLDEFSVQRQRPVNLAGITRDGTLVPRGARLISSFGQGVWKARPLTTNQPLKLPAAARLMKDQIMSRPERPAFDRSAVDNLYGKFDCPGFPRNFLDY